MTEPGRADRLAVQVEELREKVLDLNPKFSYSGTIAETLSRYALARMLYSMEQTDRFLDNLDRITAFAHTWAELCSGEMIAEQIERGRGI